MCIFGVSVRKANAKISAELTSHTSPFCNDYNKLQSFAFWSLCSFFPHAKNCAFIFSYSRTSSLVFDVREPLCVWYERLRRVVAELAHKAWWHNKGTILIYASAECCPQLRGHRGFPFKGER